MRLTTEERKAYMEKEPVAVYGMSNFGGIAIIDIVYGTDDYIVWYDSQQLQKKIHISKVYDSYFRAYGSLRIKLADCIRV